MDKVASKQKSKIGAVPWMDSTSAGLWHIATLEQGQRTVIVRLCYEAVIENFYHCEDKDRNKYLVHRQQLKPMASIPSRFNYRHFERFAPSIGAALRAYPNAITVDPGALSVETVARGLREAVEAKVRFAYTHSTINEELFKRHHDELSYSMDEGKVYVGPRAAIKAKKRIGKVQLLQTTSVNEKEITVSTLWPISLGSVCQLINDKAIEPVPRFVVEWPTKTIEEVQKIIDEYESRYNVVFAKLETGVNKYEIT